MSRQKTFLTIIYSCLLAGFTLFLSTKPSYNWDIFPYLALSVPGQSRPFPSIHKQVFDEARQAMPRGDFQAVSSLHPEISEDPQQFLSILKYFKIKPMYIFAVRGFHAMGFDLVKSTYLPSVIGYLLVGLILFTWTSRFLPPLYSAVISGLVCLSPILVGPARLSSPDMLCAFVLFTGLFVTLEISALGGLIFSVLAVLVRPDAALVVLLFDFAMTYEKKTGLIPGFVIAFLTVTISLLVMGSGLMMEMLFTTEDYSPDWSLTQSATYYFEGLAGGLPSTMKSLMFLFILISAFPIYQLRKQMNSESRTWMILVAGSVLTMVLHYLLHPVAEDRFFIAQYLIIIMGTGKAAINVARSISVQKS